MFGRMKKNKITEAVDTDVDIVDGVISVRDEALDLEKRTYHPYYQGSLLPRLLKLDDRVFFGPFYMFRKALLGDTLFSVKMTHAEDLLFFMALASKNKTNYIVNCKYFG